MKESRHFPPFVPSFHRSLSFENPSIIYSRDKGSTARIYRSVEYCRFERERIRLRFPIDVTIFSFDDYNVKNVKRFVERFPTCQSWENLFNFENCTIPCNKFSSRSSRRNFATELDFPFLFILVFHERRSIISIINDARF